MSLSVRDYGRFQPGAKLPDYHPTTSPAPRAPRWEIGAVLRASDRPTRQNAVSSPDRSDNEHVVAATTLLPTQAQPGTTKELLLAVLLG